MATTDIKQKQVTDLSEQIKNSRTLMIVSIRGLPSKQFQDIKKSLREHAKVKVAKKNIMLRAIKKVGKDSILPLEKCINADSAFVISDLEGYELAGILVRKKTPVFAKAGQEASEDIEVKSGPTDLVPGPAISELGALGIQISVEDGKIAIKQPKVVVRSGNIINQETASLLQKLNIHPFSAGLEPVAVYDSKDEKIYTDIEVNSEKTGKDLITAANKSLGFAQKIVYYCRETIGYFLAKANAHTNKLTELQVSSVPVETKTEDDTQLNQPEDKA